DVPAYLATSPLPSQEDLMEQGVKEMKKKYFDQDDNVLSSKISDVRIKMEDPEGHQVESKENHSKRRKKRRVLKKRLIPSGNSETDIKSSQEETDLPMFDIDDVSSDEELANLPPMPPLGSLGKSVSLPIMEENSLQRTSDWARTQYNTYSYLHPFSDTDMSPINSPASTRPPSPKSDTEVQLRHQEEELLFSEEDNTMWEWGDLPRKSTDDSTVVPSDLQTPGHLGPNREGTSRSNAAETSGGLFQFMRKTKAVRHKPEEEGIYLDDLKLEEMDPEVAKLYFPKRMSKHFHQSPFMSIKDTEEDTESGRGASLPVSPNSVEGAIGGPSVSFLQSEVKHLGNFSMSLCGGLSDPDGVTLEKFMQHVITFDDLCENYNMISNPELVIRISE
ncbi:phosphatidate phosphatase LPIN1-like, partial [Pecten maximus]